MHFRQGKPQHNQELLTNLYWLFGILGVDDVLNPGVLSA